MWIILRDVIVNHLELHGLLRSLQQNKNAPFGHLIDEGKSVTIVCCQGQLELTVEDMDVGVIVVHVRDV